MCFQGVWFMSRAATGPWEVATTVPQEIYTIPASSPVHHVTYVTVEDDDDDEWVTFAYVAAYTGMMIGWGCAVWGSGWYYPPYAYYGGFYPGYYPYAHTYGMGAWYNPYTGAYGRGYGRLRTVRRRRHGRLLQPAHRHLRARRSRLRSVRIARSRSGLQPAHRNLRANTSGLERLRQLGHELRAAWRQLGADRTRENYRRGTSTSGIRNAIAARRRVAHRSGGRPHDGRPHGRRRHLRRPRRQRLSTQRRRRVGAEQRLRRLELG